MQDKKGILKNKILEQLAYKKEDTDEEILSIIDDVILQYGREHYIRADEKQLLGKELFHAIRGLDMLQELMDDPEISEIMINGWQNIFVEKHGEITRWKRCFESEEKLEDIIQQMVSKSNRMVNESNPIVDARWRDGSRIHVVLSPVSLDGPAVTIRKFPAEAITMEQLVVWGAITTEAAKFLKKLVVAGYNIFVSGGTGSGKTTLLNALSNYIPEDERVVTIEDSAELQIRQIPNLVRLETRESILEGTKRISMEHLIKASLRMRPNRLIVGEVRDGEAVVNMLQALNTGSCGMSTGHANTPKDMLSRLEALSLIGMNMPLLSARKQIASAIEIVIHLGRLRDKTRRVMEIVEVMDNEENELKSQILYQFHETGVTEDGGVIGALMPTKNQLIRTEKMEKAGIFNGGEGL